MQNLATVLFIISLFFLGIAGVNYEWRAVMNKRAWNGISKPFSTIGTILLIISIGLFYFF
ncbi:hypothetical protein [Enterococcus sp. AZ126]|uniref:hypothetical protein n=1 Tax=Enterococcus sp. AZ126 TaxID=2774635 RepID=UPI003F1E9C14